MEQQQKNNRLSYRIVALFLGLILNAFGNALCVSTNTGSGIWTAAGVNISNWLHVNVGLILLIIGSCCALMNQFLIRRVDIPRFIGEVAFTSCFGYFINLFVALFAKLGVPNLPLGWRMLLSLVGVTIFASAISIYQRSNLIMHPNDDTSNILRFMYLGGRATASQLINFIPPIIMITISFIYTHQIYSVNVGTLYSIFFNGVIIAAADKHIMPGLHHNFRVPHQN
ncbi:hypothetical protein [Levilactobacillus koreensis]|uniref:Membrane protein n=1 Tax=Levilactobacillus koreensis TaxID=637971 RepID=A0AAC8UUL2_9LACO|nr:hypothetical protein [Levilactobacillus koreensis]AKP64503.1 membrane protein [Levilactobacillus koreensis]